MRHRMIVAVGGHALLAADGGQGFAGQRAAARAVADDLVRLLRAGFQVVVTHGNGPQVGAALLRSEGASDTVYPLPVDVCVASTQGEIGYVLQQALDDALEEAGLRVPVVTVVTQVVVAADDAAFARPVKPIGPVYDDAAAAERRTREGWVLRRDGAREWRRAVASPRPVEIVEAAPIATLADSGAVVIALGGGGVPVVRREGRLRGIAAVVDKDHSSALLASRLGASHYVNVTDVDRVYLDYRDHRPRPLGEVRAADLQRHLDDRHFPDGTMGPKVESVLAFLAGGGRHAVITGASGLSRVLDPAVGTHVRP